MDLDLRTGVALVGAGFLILWRTLVRRIERHDELCEKDSTQSTETGMTIG